MSDRFGYGEIGLDIHPCRGCEDYEAPDGCKSHGGCGSPMTNYDRIISKTPEELAEWINNEYGSTDWCPMDAPVDPVTRKCLVHDDCAECIVDWLKQEAGDAKCP